MSWYNESRRHSLASRGIKTAFGRVFCARGLNVRWEDLPGRLYHGTATLNVGSILDRGLLQQNPYIKTPELEERFGTGCVFFAEDLGDARFFGVQSMLHKIKSLGLDAKKDFDYTLLYVDTERLREMDVFVFSGARLFHKKHELYACQWIPPEVFSGYLRVYVDPVSGEVREEEVLW